MEANLENAECYAFALNSMDKIENQTFSPKQQRVICMERPDVGGYSTDKESKRKEGKKDGNLGEREGDNRKEII